MAKLYLRNGLYWARVVRDGREIRVSTRTREKEQAEQFLKDLIASISGYVPKEWRHAVLSDRQRRDGWQVRTHRRMRERASRKGFPCMSPDELYALLVESAGRCAITGLPVKLKGAEPRDPFLASIDRIDIRQGYSKENCRIVALIVNISLNAWGVEAVEAMAAAIISKRLATHSLDHVQKYSNSAPRFESPNALIEEGKVVVRGGVEPPT